MRMAPLDIPDTIAVVEFLPDPPDPESDPDAWALAVAKELLSLYRANGRTPILVWPDKDNPAVAVVGRKQTVDVKSKKAVNST